MSEQKIISSNAYYEKLLSVIPDLRSYNSACGGEGVAYFLDDKFVVKEYAAADDWDMFDQVFDVYCEEMQRYAEMGYKVPKIYAWVKVPNIGYYEKYHTLLDLMQEDFSPEFHLQFQYEKR